MNTILINIFLLLATITSQNEEDVKEVIKQFYKVLFRESVSIYEFSLIYGNASLSYDTGLYLKDSIGIKNYNWKLEDARNKSADEKKTSSYVLKKIKKNINNITYGLEYSEITEVIDNAEISTQGMIFSKLIELSFPNDKKIYFEVNNDTPKKVLWVWLNDATLLVDVIYNEINPEKLLLVGTINDKDGYVNIREKPTTKSKIVGKFIKGGILYYIPDNRYNWWQVSHEKNLKSMIGYVHKSRIKKYIDMSDEIKEKIIQERPNDF